MTVDTESRSSKRRRSISRKAADVVGDLAAWEYWPWVGGALLVLVVAGPCVFVVGQRRIDSAEEAVRERVQDFAAALATGDGDTACGMLEETAVDELIAAVDRQPASSESRSCASAVRVAADERTASENQALAALEIGDITYAEEMTPAIRDDPGRFVRATATVVLPGGEVALVSDTVRTDRASAWTIEDQGPILDLVAPP